MNLVTRNHIKQQTQELLKDYESESNSEGKRDIENEIIILNDALCASIAWKFQDSPIEIEDAIQVARMAMMKAIRTYNGEYQFSTHAVTVMRNDILNVLQNDQRSKRKNDNISLEKPFADGNLIANVIPSDIDVINESADRMLLRSIFAAAPTLLSKKEYQVFLFAVDSTRHTRQSLAKELNVTTRYVTMLKWKALKKIRENFSYETRNSYVQTKRSRPKKGCE